jgi:hypothetical protein
LIDTAVIVQRLTFPGAIPLVGVKNRATAFIGKDKFKAGFKACLYALPTKKFPVGPKNYVLHAAGQVILDAGNVMSATFS